jgi:hypothetical protein
MRPRAAGTQGIILPPSPDGAAILAVGLVEKFAEMIDHHRDGVAA